MSPSKFRQSRFRKYLIGRIILILIVSCFLFDCKNSGKVEELGIFSPGRLKDVAGHDGFSSIPLGNSLMMWTFGDTIIGTWGKPVSVDTTFEESASFSGMIPNSLAFTQYPDHLTIKNLNFTFSKENGKIVPFIPYKKNENPLKLRFWALDGIMMGNQVYVYYARILVDHSDRNQPFSVQGMSIASWRIPPGWKIGDTVNFTRRCDLFNGDVPTFGDAVIIKDSFLYLIGHKRTGKGSVSGFIARVKPEALLRSDSYEYLRRDGTWAGKLSEGSPFFNDISGEASLSYNETMGAYLILYCSLGGAIKAVTFSDFKYLFNAKALIIYKPPKLPVIKSRPFLFYYSGKEIVSMRDYIYAIYINPAIYQPMLIKIPVSVIKSR
ncbi:MAG TPA: hypothetical protein P5346_06395 [Spirochaetota bacterium]|nr:hypothetical protein [Spirochaetota bacterium]